MSLLDSIKSFFGFDVAEEGYETEETADELDDVNEVLFERNTAAPSRKREMRGEARVLNVNPTTQLEVVLVKPERFEDASGIADHLNSKRTVVLNLESTGKDVSRRLVDFLSGVAYANNGQIKRVANSTFIITPYNVGVMGELLDEMENSGVYF